MSIVRTALIHICCSDCRREWDCVGTESEVDSTLVLAAQCGWSVDRTKTDPVCTCPDCVEDRR